MNLLDRYISRSVIFGTLISTFILGTLIVVMFFLGELKSLYVDYTPMKALQYSLLTNTRILRDMFPMLALIGSLLGLGMLANNNELTVMRAAGVSTTRITLSVMKVGLGMMVAIALFSEFVVPASEQYAKQMRAAALIQQVYVRGNTGLWMRDGNSYINARTVKNNQQLENIFIYTMDEAGRMQWALRADMATFNDSVWMLQNVSESQFTPQGIQVHQRSQQEWKTSLQPRIVDVVSIAPVDLSLGELVRVIQHLSLNEQNAQRHEVALWSKLFSPLATGLMIFLSIPFVFGSLRSVPISQRLLNGILIGVGFTLFNEGAMRFGVVYNVPPFFSAALPTAIVAFSAWWMFRRIR